MSPDTLFEHAGTIAISGWAILLFAPRRWPLLNAVPAIILPAIISGLCAVLILQHFADAGGGYGSLTEVRTLLTSEWMFLAAWIHFLAFDLFVGAWMAKRMDDAAIHRLLQAPVLLSILYFGPLGLILGLFATGALKLPLLKPAEPRHV